MRPVYMHLFLLLTALLAAGPRDVLAAEAPQMLGSAQADEDAASSAAEAKPAQPSAQPPIDGSAACEPQREGGAPELWQVVLAQARVDAHAHPEEEDDTAVVGQTAWQVAQQAVPVPSALQCRVDKHLQRAQGSSAMQQGKPLHHAQQPQERQQEQELLPEQAASSGVGMETALPDTPEEDAAAEAAAAAIEAVRRAERRAEVERQARLQAAEDELAEAEDLVGWARDDADMDAPRGIAQLEAMFARLDGLVNAALAESVRQQQADAGGDSAGAAEAEAGSSSGSAASAEAAVGIEPLASAEAEAGEEGEAIQDGLASDEAVASAASSSTAANAADAAAANATFVAPQQQAQQVDVPSAVDLDISEHPELIALSDAAFTLAALLSSGIATAHGLPRNDSRAVHVLHQAALAGSLEARLALADRYLSGRGVPLLPDEGLRHAKAVGPEFLAQLDEAGAVSGSEGSALRLQFIDASYRPAGAGWDDANNLQYEQHLAERGDVEARRQLGYRLLTGQGVQRDLPGAFREFEVAAAAGDPYAQFNLGYMHIRGMHVSQNYTAARDHFLKAAEKQLPPALNGLGVLYFHGQGVPVNYSESVRYFALAADRDHDAAFNLATMYQGGYGVPRNMSKAIELFFNSTELGGWRAPHQLFLVLADGLYGAPKDAAQAAAAFWRFMSLTSGWRDGGKQAAERYAEGDAWAAALRYALLAEQGSPSAMLNLAWLLHCGSVHAAPDRHALALPLWLRAADRNYSEGALLAGHAYGRGSSLGLPGGTNLTAAAALYQQAAAAGSVEGLFSLGRIRDLGRGLERNASEAARLYRQAMAAAPYQAYAVAPFLALQWLRLHMLLAPLLQLGELLLLLLGGPAAGSGGGSNGRTGAAAPGAAHGQRQQLQRRSPGLPAGAQWDTLLIAAMAGALTWVLWRKRQLQQHTEQAAAPGQSGVPQLPVQGQEADHLAAAAPHRRQQQREERQV
ncbi:hypothetical protein ABPG75_013446 [Micractinium tetrahymenae]